MSSPSSHSARLRSRSGPSLVSREIVSFKRVESKGKVGRWLGYTTRKIARREVSRKEKRRERVYNDAKRKDYGLERLV